MAKLRKDLAYKIEKVNLHQKCFMRSTPGPKKVWGLIQGSLTDGEGSVQLTSSLR